jgi:hypothetical protein
MENTNIPQEEQPGNNPASHETRIEKKDAPHRYEEDAEHLAEKEREWHRIRKRMYVKRPVFISNPR